MSLHIEPSRSNYAGSEILQDEALRRDADTIASWLTFGAALITAIGPITGPVFWLSLPRSLSSVRRWLMTSPKRTDKARRGLSVIAAKEELRAEVTAQVEELQLAIDNHSEPMQLRSESMQRFSNICLETWTDHNAEIRTVENGIAKQPRRATPSTSGEEGS